MSKLIDLTGERFGKLVVLGRAGVAKHGQILWKCICDCGRETTVYGSNLRRGFTQSCLCGRDSAHITHEGTHTRLYKIYWDMKTRCHNPNYDKYYNYGGRGITVCTEWLDKKSGFVSFRNWALINGYDDKLTLDRIDVNGNYKPDNCRWATNQEQCLNTRRSIARRERLANEARTQF